MKLNILFLCNKPPYAFNANTIVDHIEAFESYSKHDVWTYSNVGDFSPQLSLAKFDVIIVHYSLSLLYDYFLSAAAKQQLKNFTGLKVLFVQDEYRQINKLISEINAIGFDILFTCFPESEIERIYPCSKLPNVSKYNNLTGYVPERLLHREFKPIKQRQVDVGYRGRKIPFWLGQLAYEKWSIAEKWKNHTKETSLNMDISCEEEDRLYGEKWIEFISSCKTMLGVESGSSVMDFTGKLETLVTFHQNTFPDDAFHEIQKIYLLEHENQYKLNQISPRCFEAVALRTVLILYEGDYSGILYPGQHYIMLKKDFSNILEVLKTIQDDEYLQRIAGAAYQEIALNPRYSYRSFIKNVDNIIIKEFFNRCKIPVKETYQSATFINAITPMIIEEEPPKITEIAQIPPPPNIPVKTFKATVLIKAAITKLSYYVPDYFKLFIKRKIKQINSS